MALIASNKRTTTTPQFVGIGGNINPTYNPSGKISGLISGETYILTIVALAAGERFTLTAGASSIISTDGSDYAGTGSTGGVTTIIFISNGNDVTVSSSGGGPSAWNCYSIVKA